MRQLPSPFLNRPELARPYRMASAFVDVLVPVALDQAYSYRVPRELDLAPGDIVAVPLGAREAIGVVWADDVTIQPGLHNRMKDVELKLDLPPLKPELRNFVDWVSDYTLAPRGMVLRMCLRMGEHLGPAREKVGVRLAGPAPQRMTAARSARAAAPRRRPAAKQERGRARGRRVGRRDRRADRRRRAGNAGAAAGAGGAAARSGSRRAGVHRRAARGGRCVARDRGEERILGDAGRRRHRLGQDRGLFRGGGRSDPARQAGADPDAGDRADRAVPRPLRRALRRAAGGMAFRACAAPARAHLGGGRGGRGAGRGRRALGAVPALCRSRPDRRR